MKPTHPTLLLRWILLSRLVAALLATLVWAGCGSAPAPSAPSKAAGAAVEKASAGAGAAASAVKSNTMTSAKSVFHVGSQSGRDPFFPNSKRNLSKAAEAASIIRLPLVAYLKLSGIWSGTPRPLAMINKTALGAGEEADVSITVSNQVGKAEVQKINVRCLEIRRDSVLINIAGEQGAKELRLAQRK